MQETKMIVGIITTHYTTKIHEMSKMVFVTCDLTHNIRIGVKN